MAVRKKAVRKKRSAKSAAVAVRDSTALELPASLREQFGQYVRNELERQTTAGGWPFIQMAGQTMKFLDNDLGDSAEFIILGSVRENLYYAEEFVPGEVGFPSCYAIAEDGAEHAMAPPEDLADKEASTCKVCWANAFGTARRGRGKACRQVVRLAVLPWPLVDGVAIDKQEAARMSVPPTSTKNWAGYSKKVLAGLGRPLFAAVTRISKIDPPANQQGFRLDFDFVAPLNDPQLLSEFAKRFDGDGKDSLFAPPQLATGEEKEMERPQRGAKKKTHARRKVVRKGRRTRDAS